MAVRCFILMLAGFVPLTLAWGSAARTTLRPTLTWVLAAWAAWSLLFWEEAFKPTGATSALRYLAVSLAACAGIAVLGARRPGLGAWNFVVVGLLLVLLLPVAEGFGEPHLGLPLFFFYPLLAVSILNYLPTRLGLAVIAAGIACAEILAPHKLDRLVGPIGLFGLGLMAVAPWLGWLGWKCPRTIGSAFDTTWRDFRDRFGLFWGLRVRDQFNRAAANAGWPVVLRWRGLERHDVSAGPSDAELLGTLQALLKRFGRKEPGA